MKILVAESSTAVGGQELAVLLHAEGLLKRGHEVRLILEPGSPICDMASRKGLPVEQVSMKRSRYPSAILAFRRLILRERPAILQLNSSRDSWIGGLAARLVRPRPKVIRIRHISTPLNRNLTTRLLYCQLLDFVIVTGGERTRCALIERDGLEANRVAAFPIGLDIEYFKPALPDHDLRGELGLPKEQKLVGLISYLRTYKGHEYFIEAAARILPRRPDVTFLIVGEGPEEPTIRARIESTGLTGGVRMLGFRDDLLNVFRSLDIFAIPSVEGDTIPQVLMQALAMGLPVVSTTVGSIPDVVLDGETGFVVPPCDAEALTDRIELLLKDHALRARLGARSRALVERSYSLDRMLDGLEKVYQRLMNM
ncbi:MAG: glycosyltransferase [Nitrospiraceae bacterium]